MTTDYISREAFVEHYRKLLCEDCDRRKGVKNGKLKFCYEIGEAPCRACAVDDMLTCVEDFPAADVRENKRGKWIKAAALAPFEQDDFRCSECDSWPWWCGVTDANLPNYCPNCGADMREEQA